MQKAIIKKILWTLLVIVAVMPFMAGCDAERANDTDSYTWLRDGNDMEDALRFSVDEVGSLTISTVVNQITITTHDGSEIVVEYIPDHPGMGNFYHHIILPRYQLINGHLEVFRDVNLAPNTFMRGGVLNVFVPFGSFSFENVSITTTGRDVDLENLRIYGQLSITTNGDIRITNVETDFNNAILNTTMPDGIHIN
ncbi:MAG: hypothetical protein FWE21_09890 [Defluviitaleaceae bacterium]|nr:hypothetical protein [Defluviitaleaceae bacterium]